MRLALSVALVLVAACTATTQPPASPQSAPPAATTPSPAPAASATPSPPASSAPAAPSALQNPNQEQNDQIAAAVAAKIAGRENEPAEKVFRNIQSLKGMPAARLVRVMNMGYSRALGVSCYHCHAGTDYSSDEKRPKRAAREMMALNKAVNEQLRAIQNLEGKPEEHFVSCTTCHRGHVDPNAGTR